MPTVQGCHFGFQEPLYQRDDAGVDDAECGIGIGHLELASTPQVTGGWPLNAPYSGFDIL